MKVSLDAPIESDNGITFMNQFVEDKNALDPEDIFLRAERKEALLVALSKIDEVSKRLIIGRFLYKKSHVELMKQENLAESAVKILLFRAKGKLKEIFEKRPELMSTLG